MDLTQPKRETKAPDQKQMQTFVSIPGEFGDLLDTALATKPIFQSETYQLLDAKEQNVKRDVLIKHVLISVGSSPRRSSCSLHTDPSDRRVCIGTLL